LTGFEGEVRFGKSPQTGGRQCGMLYYEIGRDAAVTPATVPTANALPAARSHGVGRTSEAWPDGCRAAGAPAHYRPKAWRPGVCPECGSWICAAPRAGSAMRTVRAGTLDDTSWLRPTVHFWTRSAQPWVLPEGSQRFETQPADLTGFLATGTTPGA
jgi:hypothetical protein